MNAATQQALIEFSREVSRAIGRNACGKDVDWIAVEEAQAALEAALTNESATEPKPPAA
jgi:hypothetical protein